MRFTNEHNDPAKILFFDFDAVYDMNGIVQKWHQPEKKGVCLKPELPYEGDMVLPVSIYPTADGSRVRCQYVSLNDAEMFPELAAEKALQSDCLAESRDGVHWDRVPIGEVAFRGSKDNNILPNSPEAEYKVIMDPHDPDPNRRYKGIALQWPTPATIIENSRKGRCFFSYTSPDGIHWSKPTRMTEFHETGDTSGLSYDERRGLYVFTTRQRGYWLSEEYPKFYSRPIKKGMPEGRWVSMSTSPDFVNWSPLELIMVRDGADEQGVDFYCGLPFPYGDLYAGWLRRHHFWHGTMDTELVWSRDSLRWNRSWYRKAFMEPGELGSEDWAFGDVINAKPVRSGNTLFIYYEGRNHVHGPHEIRDRRHGRGRLGMDGCMGVATMRVDGFVSLEAGTMGGNLVTEPLAAAGKRLTLNARTVSGGMIAVELLDSAFQPLAKQELQFRGDECALALAFDGNETLPPTADGKVRLRFYLENAAIYSLRIS